MTTGFSKKQPVEEDLELSMGRRLATQQLRVQRSEIKYLVAPQQAYLLSQRMGALLQRDAHARGSGYTIRSLYFDTPDARAWREKTEGIDKRQKLRLRAYASDTTSARLEIKRHSGDYSAKLGQWIPRQAALDCCDGNYSSLRPEGGLAETVAETMVRGLYRPAVLIDYEREAYRSEEFNIRITFDRSVRAAQSSDLFGERVAMTPVFARPTVILEVKFDRVLPDHIRMALTGTALVRSAVSKYCYARGLLG